MMYLPKKTIQYKEIRAVAHCNTLLNYIASFFPRIDFEKWPTSTTANRNSSHSTAGAVLAMMIAQLTGRRSLRDLADNIAAQGKRIYQHWHEANQQKAALVRVNEQQS